MYKNFFTVWRKNHSIRNIFHLYVPSLKPPFEIVGIDSFILIPSVDDINYYLLEPITLQSMHKLNQQEINQKKELPIKMTEKMFSDQGRDLQNNLFKHLSQLCGVKQLCSITFYHPQVNVQTEWQNSNISAMLEKHKPKHKKKSNTKRLLQRSY